MNTFLGSIGVPHYTKDGKLYTGEMHKDASGRLMTGKFHTANSRFLFHSRNGIGGIKGKKEDTLESLTEKYLKEFDLQAIDGRRARNVAFAQGKLMKFIIKNRLMTMDEMANYSGRLTVKRGKSDYTIK